MSTTIYLPIETIDVKPQDARTCPKAAPIPGDDGCRHPSGSCKPEGCSAC